MPRKAIPYFVYLVFDGHEHCKIGVSKHPKNRLYELQTGNPRLLKLITQWECQHKYQAVLIEQYCLQLMVDYFAYGEWVKSTPDIAISYIEPIYNKIKNNERLHEFQGFAISAWRHLNKHNEAAS